ncbi:MAG: DNA-methyltransferase [Promethearchaeota archaeon]
MRTEITDNNKIKMISLPNPLLETIEADSYDTIVISTNFDPNEKYVNQNLDSLRLENSIKILKVAFRILKQGGLLFVYGLPKVLPHLGVFLDSLENQNSKLVFKYWIALDIDARSPHETFPPTHMGLLMYLKSRKGKTTSPFHLNTKTVRIPYQSCRVCGRNTKDWGGKKHLLNPLGAAVSDVWRDLPKTSLQTNIIPDFVLNRIYELVEKSSLSFLHIIEPQNLMLKDQISLSQTNFVGDSYDLQLPVDKVILADAIEYMKTITSEYPHGIVDLAFADPPYNLEKDYGDYNDLLPDQKYLKWCEAWLDLMCRILRPGGTLMLLNLPKWCIHYADFLNNTPDMVFRHWIVWDALSEPAGKIMPAHYALLYYTKRGGSIVFNSPSPADSDALGPIDAHYYCLRKSCIKRRKAAGDDDKINLTDVWWDIHRIKHKKDRDQHPCQLPIKLMERIVKLTTNPGDIVFDPFCGAGTTAIVAKMFRRHYITTDVDEQYVEIAKQNLKMLQPTSNGYILPRKSKSRKFSSSTPRRKIEIKYMNLCRKEKRILSISEVMARDAVLGGLIKTYPDFNYLKKITRRRL